MMLPLQMRVWIEVKILPCLRWKVYGIGTKQARPVCKVFTRVLWTIHSQSHQNKGNVGCNQSITYQIWLGYPVLPVPPVLSREALKLAHVAIAIKLFEECPTFRVGGNRLCVLVRSILHHCLLVVCFVFDQKYLIWKWLTNLILEFEQ